MLEREAVAQLVDERLPRIQLPESLVGVGGPVDGAMLLRRDADRRHAAESEAGGLHFLQQQVKGLDPQLRRRRHLDGTAAQGSAVNAALGTIFMEDL